METGIRKEAQELFLIFRQNQLGSRIWWELTVEEQSGWVNVAKHFQEQLEARELRWKLTDLLDREIRNYPEIEGFKVGDRVRAVFKIGHLLNDKFAVISIEPGDEGEIIATENQEIQPITVIWDKSPITDVDPEEIEHV